MSLLTSRIKQLRFGRLFISQLIFCFVFAVLSRKSTMKVTQGTDETYIAMEGTSSNLGCNVLLLPLRATLLVIWTLKHGQI